MLYVFLTKYQDTQSLHGHKDLIRLNLSALIGSRKLQVKGRSNNRTILHRHLSFRTAVSSMDL